ncbi:MAG: CRR6 family NdhI maturation factor [Leptolyngbya sp. SIO4C1]|nr:CRR6 family NdhI maturation factor [Leptolyngbya sp. SIO4C1]
MTYTITVNTEEMQTLNLEPAETVLSPLLANPALQAAEPIRFEIDYPREASDPRELSEVPEVRLWFIRLDSRYPWLPLYLDWEAGELARYTAMLVPHQFSPIDGIRYNPEALEIFVMRKIFVLHRWLETHDVAGRNRLKQMTHLLGYDIEDDLFALLSKA